MTSNESFALRTAPSLDASERQSEASQRSLPQADHNDVRQGDSRKTRVIVLIGAAISQLPIWGFAMSYGVFQEYYQENWTLEGDRHITGIIGTTQNGVMYLSMPILFGLFTKRWARWRQTAAILGTLLATLGFVLSSFSTKAVHLVLTQGVVAALGCALVYSPTTLSLGEWYNTHNRAVAYGVVLSCKNIVGSACPFVFRALLDRYGFRGAVRIWTAMVVGLSVLTIAMMPTHPSSLSSGSYRSRRLPWSFVRQPTFWIYSVAITTQSAGYGIPQSYINSYARDVTMVSQTWATLLLTLFNIPGIASSSFFGYLSDNKHYTFSAASTTALSAGMSSLTVFLLWGLTSEGNLALLIMFSLSYGFFSSGYSATWGGILNQMEREAADRNQAIDMGMVYGLLNGVRGIGYVVGGLAAIPLLDASHSLPSAKYAYGTMYGPLIIFTGLASAVGGWGLLWKSGTLLRPMSSCCKRANRLSLG